MANFIDFEWDPVKARANYKKHGVSFERAATVFNDPRAITIYDDEHSTVEERWITLGLDYSGGLTVVSHTYARESDQTVRIRIISARKATKFEIKQYREI